MSSLALRLRFVTEKTEATRRRQGFLVVGEKLQQLELLLRCKRRRVSTDLFIIVCVFMLL